MPIETTPSAASPDAADRSASVPEAGPAACPASSLPPLPPRATARFMLAHPAHAIALGFGSGLSPVAPGTAGTLWAWLAWAALAPWLTPAQQGFFILGALLVGWWACTVTARNLGTDDPSAIVWDEVVAFWLVLWLLLPAGWLAQTLAFALFRAFDAIKRGPVGWADRVFHGRSWRGGWGILFDDLVAAFCTLLVIAAWRAWLA